MKELLNLLKRRPDLFEQTKNNIWDDDHISKSMLAAHLNEHLDSATREISFVRSSAKWIVENFSPAKYPLLLDLG